MKYGQLIYQVAEKTPAQPEKHLNVERTHKFTKKHYTSADQNNSAHISRPLQGCRW